MFWLLHCIAKHRASTTVLNLIMQFISWGQSCLRYNNNAHMQIYCLYKTHIMLLKSLFDVGQRKNTKILLTK